jgi:WD40 repeat protein
MNQTIIIYGNNCLELYKGIEKIREIPQKQYIKCISVSLNGQYIAVGGHEGMLELLNPYNEEIKAQLKGHESRVERLEFSHDSKRLVSWALGDKHLCIWDVQSSTCLHRIKLSSYRVRSITFSINDSIVAYDLDNYYYREKEDAPKNNTIIFLDILNGKAIKKLKGHKSYIEDMAFSPVDENIFVSTDQKCVTYRWDLSLRKAVKIFHHDIYHFTKLKFFSDGERIATVSHNGHLKIWNVYSDTLLQTFPTERTLNNISA